MHLTIKRSIYISEQEENTTSCMHFSKVSQMWNVFTVMSQSTWDMKAESRKLCDKRLTGRFSYRCFFFHQS